MKHFIDWLLGRVRVREPNPTFRKEFWAAERLLRHGATLGSDGTVHKDDWPQPEAYTAFVPPGGP